VFGGFAVGAYYLSNNVTRYVLEETRIGLYLYHRFISMIMFVFFVAVNLGNIIVSYSTLYRSTEVYYLLTKPISHTQIFILKFLDNFLYSSTTLFLVAFMVLFGYGNYFGYPWYFFAGVMLFVLIPFMFISACLAVVILMAIMKLAGRIGFRKVMATLFVVYFFFIFLFFKVSNPIKLVEDVNRFYPNVDAYLSTLTPGFLQYLPSHWVAEFLFYTARGEPLQALPLALVLLGTSVALFLLCVLIASKFYYRSWMISLQVQASGSMPYDPERTGAIDFRRGGLLSPQMDSLLKKEFFTFVREPSQWIHLVVMVILTLLFVFSVGSLNLRLRLADLQLITYLVLFTFGGFLTSSLGLRFVYPMVSLEGNSFWSLRSAPISVRRMYLTKFFIGLAMVMGLALLVGIATNVPFVRFSGRRPLLLYFGIFNAFWMSLALVSLNLSLGGFFSTYTEKNPIRIASTQGATLTFLLSLVYLFFLTVVVVYPVSEYFQSLFVFKQFNQRLIVVPGTILAMLSAAIVGVGYSLGMKSMQRDL
jgi:ABC-2 type transport system permease protein